MILNYLGSWGGGESCLPEDIQGSGDYSDQAFIELYLRGGVIIASSLSDYTPLPPLEKDAYLGNRILTDGVWAWPESLIAYFTFASISLPDRFIAHVRDLDYQVPCVINKVELCDAVPDYSVWRSWTSAFKKPF